MVSISSLLSLQIGIPQATQKIQRAHNERVLANVAHDIFTETRIVCTSAFRKNQLLAYIDDHGFCTLLDLPFNKKLWTQQASKVCSILNITDSRKVIIETMYTVEIFNGNDEPIKILINLIAKVAVVKDCIFITYPNGIQKKYNFDGQEIHSLQLNMPPNTFLGSICANETCLVYTLHEQTSKKGLLLFNSATLSQKIFSGFIKEVCFQDQTLLYMEQHIEYYPRYTLHVVDTLTGNEKDKITMQTGAELSKHDRFLSLVANKTHVYFNLSRKFPDESQLYSIDLKSKEVKKLRTFLSIPTNNLMLDDFNIYVAAEALDIETLRVKTSLPCHSLSFSQGIMILSRNPTIIRNYNTI